MPREGKALIKAEKTLKEFALGFPETYEEFPWGHRAVKVGKKVFAFMGLNDEGMFLSVKLPESNHAALALPFTEPTGYGLGKSGWVSANFGLEETPPVELLQDWIEESYCAIAPKKLMAQL